MTTSDLDDDLASIAVGRDPDGWAFAAYRAAVARSESAGGADGLSSALDLLGRAGRILTAVRSPVEHGRILTAAANCHRRLGDPARAAELFDDAAGLLIDRTTVAEQAAAFVNLGLARIETGNPAAAMEPLGAALELTRDATDDELRRVRGAAFVNRAQAHQAIASVESLRAASVDYGAAADVLDAESPQRGMALHGLGSATLELCSKSDPAASLDVAIEAFETCLRILTANAFPFQHAVGQHSLAIAYERRRRPLDGERALIHLETALSMFDPRLHRQQWETAAAALARIEAQLGVERPGANRHDHFVRLLSTIDDHQRGALLRDRLVPLSVLPAERIHRDLDALARSLTAANIDQYDVVVRSLLPVLMELPESVLAHACDALSRAQRDVDDSEARAQCLDSIIHDLLHGPQRVRVRDLLEASGWVRP